VYVVALSDSASSAEAALPTAPLSRSALKHLLAVRAELKLDLAAAVVDALIERPTSTWRCLRLVSWARSLLIRLDPFGLFA